ncbi:MAG TPA: DUF1987 domain-containing protein [Bacteroidales bacterium]|nr:DUF1987 domain-containing protein [Bacteroidales bacterium]
MNNKIFSTEKTPEVNADFIKGKVELIGVLIPENPLIFFGQMESIIEECKANSDNLQLDFKLDYFNTGAARYIYDIFKKLKNHPNCIVNWYYEADDEDIYESGTEFQQLSGLKFNFIEK